MPLYIRALVPRPWMPYRREACGPPARDLAQVGHDGQLIDRDARDTVAQDQRVVAPQRQVSAARHGVAPRHQPAQPSAPVVPRRVMR